MARLIQTQEAKCKQRVVGQKNTKQRTKVGEINRRESIFEEEESSGINRYRGRRGEGTRL
jgi:hypothetical protein